MTPTEFREYYEAKEAARLTGWQVSDNMNAMICYVVARCAGNSDVKPADFLTIRREPDEKKTRSDVPENGDTPEEIMRKLEILTVSMGGKVVRRG